MDAKKDSCGVGNISEAGVLYHLVKSGYKVYLPYGEGHRADIVIEENGEFKRIQVKTSWKTACGFSIQLWSRAGGIKKKRYTENEIDYFATMHNGEAYLIPLRDIRNSKVNITLRVNKKVKKQPRVLESEQYRVN